MKQCLAPGYHTNAYLRHPEWPLPTGGRVIERPRCECHRAGWYCIPTKGTVAWTVTYLILELGVKGGEIPRDCAGEHTTGAYTRYPHILQQRMSEADVRLLTHYINVRAAIDPQLQHKPVSHISGTTVGWCSRARPEFQVSIAQPCIRQPYHAIARGWQPASGKLSSIPCR